MKYPYKHIGRRIRRLRKQFGLTQVQLASRLERHQVYISSIERGQIRPPRVLLHALSNLFNVPLEESGREFLESDDEK